MAFSKELEALIEAVLADGVITETERKVLYEEARREGVDPRKVEIMVEARLHKMQKTIDDSKQKVRKCPSCGEIIPAMTAVCPSCGYVVDVSNSDNKALDKFIGEIESLLVRYKDDPSDWNKAKLENAIHRGRTLYGENNRIAKFIEKAETAISKLEKSERKTEIRVWIGLAIMMAFGLGFFGIGAILEENEDKEWEREYEKKEIIELAQYQRDSLISLIKALPTPNKHNYKQCETDLMKIIWIDIICPTPTRKEKKEGQDLYYLVNSTDNSQSIKSSYLFLKRSYASLIFQIYKEIYKDNAEEKSIAEISDPQNNIIN